MNNLPAINPWNQRLIVVHGAYIAHIRTVQGRITVVRTDAIAQARRFGVYESLKALAQLCALFPTVEFEVREA